MTSASASPTASTLAASARPTFSIFAASPAPSNSSSFWVASALMIVACFSPSARRIAAWRPASAGFTTVACSSFSLRSASCSWTRTSCALRTCSIRVSCS